MATIVRDGVGGGGNLFAGIKFFLLQRLPIRQRWLDLINSNGGEVVVLEKQANLVISDHARSDCPAGSVSWKYIDESVKKGRLEDVEDHRAGPKEYSPREVGSGRPTKQRRTPFTTDDDRILANWVLDAERDGLATKGNEIYKQLEIKNPRHPAQAWRDRWVKYLSGHHHPEPSIDPPLTSSTSNVGLVSGPDRAIRRPAQRRPPNERTPESHSQHVPRTQKLPQPSRLATAPRNAPRNSLEARSAKESLVPTAEITRPYVAKSAGGMNFTEEEEELLIGMYKDILNLDEDRSIEAWLSLAVEYPNHTAQEWRNYFFKTLAPRLQESQTRKTKPPQQSQSYGVSTARSKHTPPQQASLRNTRDSGSQGPVATISEAQSTGDITDEELFKDGVSTLAESLGEKVNFNPVICGKAIPLFRLWQVVRSDEFGGFDEVSGRRLWHQVARRLNYSDYQHPSAASELESCYKLILVDFDEAKELYNDTIEDMTESQEQAMIESQLRKTAARESQNMRERSIEDGAGEPPADHSPSTPPRVPSTSSKRGLNWSRTNRGASPTTGSGNKRQRTEKGNGPRLEIPSTPDETLKKHQVQHPSYKPSPHELASPIASQEVDEDSELELFVKPFKKVGLSPPARGAVQQVVEPETQDFYFPGSQHEEMEHPIPKGRNPSRNVNEDFSAQSRTEPGQSETLSALIDRYVSLGYSEEHVILALDATTLNTGDMGIVVEALHSGNGIPDDIQGVWTHWDDEALEGADHPDLDSVSKKHGAERVDLRRRFLADQKLARSRLSQDTADS